MMCCTQFSIVSWRSSTFRPIISTSPSQPTAAPIPVTIIRLAITPYRDTTVQQIISYLHDRMTVVIGGVETQVLTLPSFEVVHVDLMPGDGMLHSSLSQAIGYQEMWMLMLGTTHNHLSCI